MVRPAGRECVSIRSFNPGMRLSPAVAEYPARSRWVDLFALSDIDGLRSASAS